MPRIDPQKLLTCLSVLLAPNGGIRSSEEVKRLAGLMDKFSKKLVSKCIYIQICKCTETELLGQFMAAGGWSLTHNWLSDGIATRNWPLLRELLELLLLCPVDVARLKSNSAPKLVKQLSKEGNHENVRILATKLVEQWLKIVKGETLANAAMDDKNVAILKQSASSLSENYVNDIEDTIVANRIAKVSLNNPSTVSDQKAPASDSLTCQNSSEQGQRNCESVDVESDQTDLVYKITTSKSGKSFVKKSNVNQDNELVSDDISVGASESKDRIENDNKSYKDNKKSSGDESVKNKDRQKEKSRDEKSKDDKAKEKNREKERSKEDRDRSHKKSSTSSSSKSTSSSKSSSKTSSHNSSSKSSSHRSSSSSSKHRSSSTSSKENRDDKERSKSSSSLKSTPSSATLTSTIKDKPKDDGKLVQAEKDKDTLAKLIPLSLDKLGKIPKKSKDEIPASDSIVLKRQPSISIEVRKDVENRPKTVKTFNSQFRSHGLDEGPPPPPSRKGLKKPVNSLPSSISIPPSAPLKRLSPPPMEIIPEKKVKIEVSLPPPIEKPIGIKLIAAKPKPALLVESDMFMDALSAASPVPKKDSKKRKRRMSISKEGASSSPPESPTTPSTPPIKSVTSSSPLPKTAAVAPAAPALKFYQETLNENEDSKKQKTNDNEETIPTDEKSNDETAESKTEDVVMVEAITETKEIEDAPETITTADESQNSDDRLSDSEPTVKTPGPGCGPDGPPGVLVIHRRRGPKKKLQWRPLESLEEVRYFELDENERVNVTKTFMDAKHMERIQERELVQTARNKYSAIDKMYKEIDWRPLIEVEGVPRHPAGSQSKEKKIQIDREQTVLKVLYFSRHNVPESPSEPDMEYYQVTDPTVIPLNDTTLNPDGINDLTSMPWPDPKGVAPQIPMGINVPPFAPAQPFMPMEMPQQNWSMNSNMLRMPMVAPQGFAPAPPAVPHFNNNFPINMISNLGLNLKDGLNMNMRGPTVNNGNWFRPGGPPNWLNNSNNNSNKNLPNRNNGYPGPRSWLNNKRGGGRYGTGNYNSNMKNSY